jgi:hypothetical protein
MDLQKIGISAGAGAIYTAGAVVTTAACAGIYSLVNNYFPSFKGTLNAGLVMGASSMGAIPISKFLDNREYETLSKITGALTIFLATAILTPKVSNLLSTYQVSYSTSSLYGLVGAGTFLQLKPDRRHHDMSSHTPGKFSSGFSGSSRYQSHYKD